MKNITDIHEMQDLVIFWLNTNIDIHAFVRLMNLRTCKSYVFAVSLQCSMYSLPSKHLKLKVLAKIKGIFASSMHGKISSNQFSNTFVKLRQISVVKRDSNLRIFIL